MFKNEIISVSYEDKSGNEICIEQDEQISKVNFEKIPNLKPAFVKDGSVTAANSSPISDGASMLVLMSEKKANELNINPIAEIIGYNDSATSPDLFTIAPAKSVENLLNKTKENLSNIDLFEINEAFSMVPLVNIDMLSIDPKKVNITGGAVSLGHPLGSSGSRIVVTLINVLNKKEAKLGADAICNGGGGASALIIEKK